jgi:hypothetical protein
MFAVNNQKHVRIFVESRIIPCANYTVGDNLSAYTNSAIERDNIPSAEKTLWDNQIGIHSVYQCQEGIDRKRASFRSAENKPWMACLEPKKTYTVGSGKKAPEPQVQTKQV